MPERWQLEHLGLTAQKTNSKIQTRAQSKCVCACECFLEGGWRGAANISLVLLFYFCPPHECLCRSVDREALTWIITELIQFIACSIAAIKFPLQTLFYNSTVTTKPALGCNTGAAAAKPETWGRTPCRRTAGLL